MGVLFDYFRAADDTAAAGVAGSVGGPLVPDDDGQPPFDGVDAKGVDPAVTLAMLVAIISEVPWSTDLVATTAVWPPPETEPNSVEDAKDLPEDSPWVTGPWVEQLADRTRDTLADTAPARHREIAGRWAQIEEFELYTDVDADALQPLVSQLVGLAQRARAAGEHLYCWSSL
jgi:hypothetical protein